MAINGNGSQSHKGKVQVQRDQAVALITINNPPANAIDAQVLMELEDYLDEIEADKDVRAVIITGSGPKMFSAGADINVFVKGDIKDQERLVELGTDLFGRIEAFPKPVIAAINGICLGGGNELAMACDIRIAVPTARFGQPEINLGLIPGWGGIQRLSRLIGKAKARELLLTGAMIVADEAKAVGLVNKVVPPDQLMTEARALAVKLAAQAPLAVAETKRFVYLDEETPLTEGIRQGGKTFLRILHTQDGKEGVAAFLEKRPPKFNGS